MEFTEGLKKVFLAGVGAVATTAETGKDVVNKLVTKGELTVEQGKVLNEELKRNAKEKVKERKEKDFYQNVEMMTAEERQALREKLQELDQKEAEAAKESEGTETEAEIPEADGEAETPTDEA